MKNVSKSSWSSSPSPILIDLYQFDVEVQARQVFFLEGAGRWLKKIFMSNEFSESLIVLCTRMKSRLKTKEEWILVCWETQIRADKSTQFLLWTGGI